ncbi:MAG TPA: patatin, partial [Candidatus Marinimicrobia bacterium]|nr:patatin [Candidatus Neomarinimicrobiota bacterium]
MAESKIGIALGSGSARGWSHIGVLEALDELGIPIHCIAGTSIGAYVGFAYAAGDLKKLKEFSLTLDKRKIFSHLDLIFPRSGFFEGKRFSDLIKAATDAKSFEELQISFAAVATDMLRGEEVVFKDGDPFLAIRASASVPGLLTPVKWKNRLLVDGGVVNPVPMNVLREMGAEKIIAIDLNSQLLTKRFGELAYSDTKRPKKIKAKNSDENNDFFHLLALPKNPFFDRVSKQLSLAERTVRDTWSHFFNGDDGAMPSIFDIYGSSIDIMETQLTRISINIHKPDLLIQPSLGDIKLLDFDQAERAIREGYEKT